MLQIFLLVVFQMPAGRGKLEWKFPATTNGLQKPPITTLRRRGAGAHFHDFTHSRMASDTTGPHVAGLQKHHAALKQKKKQKTHPSQRISHGGSAVVCKSSSAVGHWRDICLVRQSHYFEV